MSSSLIYVWNIIIIGNEARHFTVKEDTPSVRSDAEPPETTNYNYTSLLGVSVPFVGKM